MLNSKILTKELNSKDTQVGTVYRHYKYNLETLPIPRLSAKEQKPFEVLVDKILAKKKAGKPTAQEEAKVDALVCDLYGLTPDERDWLAAQ